MTEAEKFYIDGHVGKKTEKEMAKALKLTLRQVQAYLRDPGRAPKSELDTLKERVEAAEKERDEAIAKLPKKEPGPLAGTSFATDNGTVSMTASQSMSDDEKGGTSPFKKKTPEQEAEDKKNRNQEFYETHKKNIHVIDPKLPYK